jgi:predicted dehydrogenase
MTLRFGIVGCGGAAVDIAHAIDAQADAHLVATYDRVATNAADLATPRGATVHADLDGLLADPSVDVVYIGLPHDLLAPTATLAVEAGKHALVEKPMAITVEDIRALERLARSRDRRVGVVFELRQVAAMEAARGLVQDGAIGDVRAVRIQTVIDKPDTYWTSGPTGRVVDDWRAHRDRAGGGVVLMNAIHLIDLVRWISDSSFVRAMAEVGSPLGSVEVEDRAAAALTLENGAIVSLAAAAHSAGAEGQEQIQIDGTFGRLDLPDPYTAAPLRAYVRRPRGELTPGRWHVIDPPTVDPFVRYLDRFTAAVATGGRLPADAGDAAAALATVEAIYASAETGRAVSVAAADPLLGE